MTYAQLEHAIRAACKVSGDTELWVFGSQAILASIPDAPDPLTTSIEIDVQPVNRPETVTEIDGALGELSPFHAAHGFYVHGVSIESATFPKDWEARTIPVSHRIGTRGYTGRCVEAHDIAASKLVAYRDKDRSYVRTLILEGLIDKNTLIDRLSSLSVDDENKSRMIEWVRITGRG